MVSGQHDPLGTGDSNNHPKRGQLPGGDGIDAGQRFGEEEFLLYAFVPLARGPEVAKGRTREDVLDVRPDASAAQIW
jgi:hypothetical protein